MTQAEILALGGFITMVLAVLLVLWVLLVIARWKMFTKAGEKGWKALIPMYADYTLFKLVWNTKSFWIFVALGIVSSLVSSITGQLVMVDGQMTYVSNSNFLLDIISFVASTGLVIYSVLVAIKTALAYGKRIPFAIGLFFLPNIFTLILAFGSAKYIGPQE